MDIKLKNKLLLLGFLASLVLAYKLAISTTLETQAKVHKLTKEKLLLNNISNKIVALETKEQQLNAVLKKRNISFNNSFQQTLLQNLSTFAKKNNLQIIAFKQPHTYTTDISTLVTYSFELKGDFISLLKLTNFLEKLQLGALISINFEKKKQFTTNKNFLTCSVLLQKIES